MKTFKDKFEFYGEPTNMILKTGDIDGILYNKRRFTFIEGFTSHIDCIENPDLSHTLVYIILEDLQTHKQFAVFNTHLPFSCPEARLFSARYIAEEIQKKAKLFPLILAGDFNTISQRLDYRGLPFYDGDYIKKILTENLLKDAIDKSILGHIGPISTFTNSPKEDRGIPLSPFMGTGIPGIFLDHIFVTENVHIIIHAIESACIDGEFPSDHMPIIVDMLIDP